VLHSARLPSPPLAHAHPWRRAAYVAVGIAAIELLLLAVAGVAIFAKPFADQVERTAAATVAKATAPAIPPGRAQGAPGLETKPVPQAKLPRRETSVLVLNGNGRNGAAGEAASVLQGLRYLVAGTADAPRTDVARTIIMFRRGFEGEAWRLAKDVRVKRVAPLDGMKPADLQGAHVVLILGGRS